MKAFYRLLAVTLVAVTANNFVWFALTYWAYLTTRSVVATSTMAGIFLVLNAGAGIWIGSIVDHHKKRVAMLGSSVVTLTLFAAGLLLYSLSPTEAFATVESWRLWLLVTTLLCGTIAGGAYMISMPVLVAIVVPEEMRTRANGMFGTAVGIAFGITAVASGLTLAAGGMGLVLKVAVGTIAAVIVALLLIRVDEPEIVRAADAPKSKVDLRGTIAAVRAVPGLVGLIIFTTFNNLLGGVFFSLMDAYGLTLVSVEIWGVLWGVLSLFMILGGVYISRRGIGGNPVRVMFRVLLITWATCLIFPLQPSVLLLIGGTVVWLFCAPFIEASEQTIFQTVVPSERLGRVFGFAHAVEQSASPLMAFMIGPITQLLFIPWMTEGGGGARLIGSWFGAGTGRGIALVFIVSGVLGMILTLVAMRSKAYALLARQTEKKSAAAP